MMSLRRRLCAGPAFRRRHRHGVRRCVWSCPRRCGHSECWTVLSSEIWNDLSRQSDAVRGLSAQRRPATRIAFWGRLPRRLSAAAVSTPSHGCDLRLVGPQRFGGRWLSIRQRSYRRSTFEITDQRSIVMIAAPCAVADPDDFRGRETRVASPTHGAQQSVVAIRHAQSAREACRQTSPGEGANCWIQIDAPGARLRDRPSTRSQCERLPEQIYAPRRRATTTAPERRRPALERKALT